MSVQENLLMLRQAEDFILRNRLKQAIDLQRDVALMAHVDFLKDKIGLQQEAYRYLLHFFTQGSNDPMRHQVFSELKLNLLHINDQLQRFLLLEHEPFYGYHSYLSEQRLELDIKQMDTESLARMFNSIWLYPSISETEYERLKKFFESQVHWVAKAMAVSALTLSLLTFFDAKKILLLFDLVQAGQWQVWERALIGLLFVLYLYDNRLELYPEIISRLKLLPELPAYEEKMKAVIIQIIRSAKETAILQERFEKEIIPQMQKIGSDLEEKLNLEELMADDMLDEDENPEWEQLLDVEEGFLEKMTEFSMLQLEGADVMHSAFSKMKFFDFFQDLPNWFMPFYAENQQIINFVEQVGVEPQKARAFVESLAESYYICNSDKYSLVFQLQFLPNMQVVDATIELLRMESDSVSELRRTDELSDVLGKSRPVIIQYVQDLYRFFKLYPKLNVLPRLFDLPLDFYNKGFFRYIGTEQILRDIGDFYFTKKFYDEAISIFQKLISSGEKSAELYEKLGFAYQKKRNYQKALEYYQQATLYQTRPNKWLTKKLAFTLMKTGNFRQAIEYYEQLLSQEPDNLKWIINIGNCYLNLGEFDQALKYYFKVEYYSPSNPKVMRPIGWIAFRQGQLEKAKKFYDRVLETKPKPIDFITAGHIYFASGDLPRAIELYKKAKSQYSELSEYEKDFFEDRQILEQQYKIPKLDLDLLFESTV